MFTKAATLLFFLTMLSAPLCNADGIRAINIDGTSFRVIRDNGKELGPPDLVGAIITLDLDNVGKRSVRIDKVVADARDKDGEVWLYDLSLRDEKTSSWNDVCGPDPDGKHYAFPLRGKWDNTGHRISDDGVTLACTGGALGKCVRFGYKPWKTTKDGNSLLRYHEACVHLVRADYCGNDSATTETGTPIDLFDSVGIQPPEQDGMKFEAAWNEHGAICVAHPRIPKNTTLENLARSCPRLVGHLGEQACEEKSMINSSEAILFNRSH
jgi:hypothetical protein